MTTNQFLNEPLLLETQYRDYVWGGNKLRPQVAGPTAEAWVVYENDRIQNGSLAGRTLAEIANSHGEQLLGRRVFSRGRRFPLLIKLLDCAAWLSIQVHPNDEQARRLEGPEQNGKTEAWHIISAEPGATLLCGVKAGIPRNVLDMAVRQGTILDVVQKWEMSTGDSLLIQAGMLHALGPGLLVYEVQQTSDITYRVFDWNRPASEGRQLHIDKSLAVINPELEPKVVPSPSPSDGERACLVQSEYFRLELFTGQHNSIEMDTAGETFHALTVLDGRALLKGIDWEMQIEPYQSVVIPAICRHYSIIPEDRLRVLRSAVD